jgi:arylsulfatase A-like enzyme
MLLCDDLGYGDTGYAGHPRLKTPGLDRLAKSGVCLNRFYAGGPVCSPTRGTCLTGRHYIRYGINHANQGRLPAEEITLPKLLNDHGYTTGHFGKWHLGTLDRSYSAKHKDPNRHYAPPWERGYDYSFATESRVPTWNPQQGINVKTNERTTDVWGTPYYENGTKVDAPLLGCDSQIIMDRALRFIENSVNNNQISFSTIWFHAPHTPVVAGPEWLAQYADCNDDEAHYFGCVSAMDHQINRLLDALDEWGISDQTMTWFASDNGPEGSENLASNGRNQGRTGGLRGRKRSLYAGGLQVPALVHWPHYLKAGSPCEAPLSTLDYLPTICSAVGIPLPKRPMDGIDIMPLLAEQESQRARPIPCRYLNSKNKMFDSPTFGLIDNEMFFYSNLSESNTEEELYNVIDDPAQEINLISKNSGKAQQYRQVLSKFLSDCRSSHRGDDYPDTTPPFDPITSFQEPGNWL